MKTIFLAPERGTLENWACMNEGAVLCSVVSDSVTPWTVARQAPLSMGFSRQESWSGLPFPSPGDLPGPGIKPTFPALAGRFFPTEPPGKPLLMKRRFALTTNHYLCTHTPHPPHSRARYVNNHTCERLFTQKHLFYLGSRYRRKVNSLPSLYIEKIHKCIYHSQGFLQPSCFACHL